MDYLWSLSFYVAAIIFINYIPVYYFKFILYYLWTLFCGGLYMPLAVLRPKNVLNLKAICKALKYSRTWCGLKYQFKGLENINKEKCCVMVANHQSSLDLIGMYEHWDHFGKLVPIGKRELLFAGTFGLYLHLGGTVFIRRNTGAKAGQEINQIIERLKKEDTKLWVFPEGTRRNTGEIHQFKKGAFHAAIHAQVPIVPVVYSSYKSFLSDDKKVFNDGEIIIEVLPEIPTKGMTLANIDKLIEHTRSEMIKVFNSNSSPAT